MINKYYDAIYPSFNRQVSKTPHNIAVVDEDSQLTYLELWNKVNDLASILIRNNIKRNDYVVVYLPHKKEIEIAVLAIWLIGAIYVPVDQIYPIERLKYIIDDTKSKVVLSISKNNINFKGVNTINLDKLQQVAYKKIEYKEISCNDAATILYTSGTSGKPKGVVLSHETCRNSGDWRLVVGDALKENDYVAVTANFSTGPALPFLFLPLITGATVDIIPHSLRNNISELHRYLIEKKASDCYLPTSLAIFLAEHFSIDNINIIMAGEKPRPFITKSKIPLINIYGATECMFISGSKIYGNEEILPSGEYYYGDILIVDDKLCPVGDSKPGELLFHSDVIETHYLNLPNEEKDKYLLIDNKRFYRTGDLAKMVDNVLYVLGRSEEGMVKINGNRVEINEVETALIRVNQKFPQGENFDNAICVVKEKNHINYLCCYYEAEKSIDVDKYKSLLSDKLPQYMIPAYFIQMNKLPRNTNGKVMTSILPDLVITNQHEQYVAPRNNNEKLICEAFSKALIVDNVGINDEFFQLGGDSLAAIVVTSIINSCNVTTVDILDLQTPKNIAKKLGNKHFCNELFKKYVDTEYVPLSDQQLNVYLDEIVNHKETAYLVPLVINVPNLYNVDDVEQAVIKVCNKHEILLSHVEIIDSKPCLKFGDDVNITKLKYKESWIFKTFFTTSFDLSKSLCRFVIFEDTDHNLILFCAFHHLIFDGYSNNVFYDDFFKALENKSINEDKNFRYSSSFSEYIKQHELYKEANNFYLQQFGDINDLPDLLPDVSNEKGSYFYNSLKINIKELDDFILKNRISLSVFFTAAFGYTLSRFTGTDDCYFCLLDNGRDLTDGTGIGMFVYTLPIYFNCQNTSIKNYLQHCKDIIYKTISYNFYSFVELVKQYNLNSNIFFQYHPNTFLLDHISSKYGKKFFELDGDFINGLDVVVYKNKDKFEISTVFSEKYSRDTANRLFLTFQQVINQFLTKKDLKDIYYINKNDLNLFKLINSTNYSLVHSDILEAFCKNVDLNPNNTCLSWKDRKFSYKQTAQIINSISQRLLHVHNKSHIGILVERSHHYLTSALCVLLNDCAYVPIYENFPDARIKFMLQDANVKTLLVTDKTHKRAKSLIEKLSINIELINISQVEIISDADLKIKKYNPDSTACILYTSGTTGTPKGNLITRRALLNISEWYAYEHNLSKNDVYGMYTVSTFDMHTIAFYAPLIVGAALHIIPEEFRLDLNKLNKYFIEKNISHTFLPTQIGKLFNKLKMPTSIKVMEVAGEKLGKFIPPTDYDVYDVYGPTESMVVTSINTKNKITYSSVGCLINNIQCYILDKERRTVPFGAVGELYLTGFQLSSGYLNRKEINEQSFIDNPYKFIDGNDKLYKTGDIARFLPDKTISILGRKDGQIKIRGNRIELSEVEITIRAMSEIDDVTVQALNNDGNNELIAYVVSKKIKLEEEIKSAVIDFVSKRKPSFMIPSHVVLMKKIPLNSNGKVDKRALPDIGNYTSKRTIVLPRNNIEKIIVEVFEKIFKNKKISVLDDFINLGGDSILAVKLISMIYEKNVDLKISSLLKGETIETISKKIIQNKQAITEDIFIYNKDKKLKNLFLVHTMNAGSELYYRLADRLKNDYSVAVFEQYNLNHPDKKIKSIDGLADKYISLMKKIQQNGPYFIGGWSYGGTIAFAMANKLEEMNEEVKLILLDTSIIYDKKIKKIILDDIKNNTREYLLNDPLFKNTKNKIDVDTLINNSNTMTPVWLNYLPKNYNGQILYFRANQVEANASDAKISMFENSRNFVAGGYEKYLTNFTPNIVNLNCPHDNMLDEKYVDIISENIINYLKGDF